MVVTKERQGSKVYIRVNKDIIDMESAEEFKSALMESYANGDKDVVIDFSKSKMINSYGIGKILMFYKKFREIGGQIQVTKLSGFVKEAFETLMLDRIIKEE